MAEFRNNLSGIADSDIITQLNSGGASGDAFGVISGSPTVFLSADITDGSDRGFRADLVSDTAEYVGWSITPSTSGFVRFYFNAASIAKTFTYRMLRLYDGATIRGEVRLDSALNHLQFTDEGGFHVARYESLLANTTYRVEIDWTTGSPEMRVYLGESTTPQPIVAANPTATFGSVSSVRFGAWTTAAQTVNDVRLACPAWSDTSWLGPETAGIGGNAVYNLTITQSAPSTASVATRVYEIDASSSTGTVSLVWNGASRGTITESPTGVYSIADPDDGDMPLELTLTASGSSGGADDIVAISIPRGGAGVRSVLVFGGGDPGDISNWE